MLSYRMRGQGMTHPCACACSCHTRSYTTILASGCGLAKSMQNESLAIAASYSRCGTSHQHAGVARGCRVCAASAFVCCTALTAGGHHTPSCCCQHPPPTGTLTVCPGCPPLAASSCRATVGLHLSAAAAAAATAAAVCASLFLPRHRRGSGEMRWLLPQEKSSQPYASQ